MTCCNAQCPCHQFEDAALPYPLDPEAQAAADSGYFIPRQSTGVVDTEYDQFEGGQGSMRAFDTGATRNLDVDPDIYGFTSPLALGLFAEYMHENRVQADGTIRDSDNWKKGIPLDSYVRSMRRHMQDLTLHHDGYGELAREDLFAALGGLFFNIQGYMHEVVKQGVDLSRGDGENWTLEPWQEGLLDLFLKPTVFIDPQAEYPSTNEPLTITADDGGEEEVDGLA